MSDAYMPSWHRRIIDGVRSLLMAAFPPKHDLPPDAVVLVLDAIEPYRSLWTRRNDRCLRSLLRQARRAERPIIFTRWDRTREWPRDVIAEKGHWTEFLPHRDPAFLPGLVGDDDQVVSVVHANAFTSRAISDAVGARPLVLAGMWTEACVACTARAAAERNVRVHVAADCCSGHRFAHLLALWTMQALFATVIRVT